MSANDHTNIGEKLNSEWNLTDAPEVETWDEISYKNPNQKTHVKINQN